MVRCILVDTTVPVRIRPRMETRPVKGHFLSVEGSRGQQSFDSLHALIAHPFTPRPAVPQVRAALQQAPRTTAALPLLPGNSSTMSGPGYIFHVPMYWPSMAVLGVRKPRPTSLYHRRCPISSAFAVLLYRHVQHGYSWVTHTTLAGTLGLALGDKRDVRLLLESTLRLDGQLGSHVCG